jgi:hypothetical protein
VKAVRARSGLGASSSRCRLQPSNFDSSVSDRNRHADRISGTSFLKRLNPRVRLNRPFPASRNRSRRKRSRQRVAVRVGAHMLAFILVEPSSLATKLYAAQELIAALLLIAIFVAIITAFLAIAVLLQEAGRSGIRWGKRSRHRHDVLGNRPSSTVYPLPPRQKIA